LELRGLLIELLQKMDKSTEDFDLREDSLDSIADEADAQIFYAIREPGGGVSDVARRLERAGFGEETRRIIELLRQLY